MPVWFWGQVQEVLWRRMMRVEVTPGLGRRDSLMSYDIASREDMVEAFDWEQPRRGRETTAFIKRWRKKEREMPHRSHAHLVAALHLINRAEIESIRSTKHFRDAPRNGNNRLAS